MPIYVGNYVVSTFPLTRPRRPVRPMGAWLLVAPLRDLQVLEADVPLVVAEVDTLPHPLPRPPAARLRALGPLRPGAGAGAPLEEKNIGK